jgi:mannosyltransferase OCH1-like enzyme
MTIPHRIHQLWVGPLPAPEAWLATWPAKHPGYEFERWGEAEIGAYPWRPHVRDLIEHWRSRKNWPGVADCARYQILHDLGGFWATADSQCLYPVTELLDAHDWFAVATNERHRPGDVAPIIATTRGHPFMAFVLEELEGVDPGQGSAVETVGNRFLTRCVEAWPESLTILPSYTFIPTWKGKEPYTGPGKVYATHEWGTTTRSYARGA